MLIGRKGLSCLFYHNTLNLPFLATCHTVAISGSRVWACRHHGSLPLCCLEILHPLSISMTYPSESPSHQCHRHPIVIWLAEISQSKMQSGTWATMCLSSANFVPEHRVFSQGWYIRYWHPGCYTRFVQMGVFRVTIWLCHDHVLCSNIAFTHALICPNMHKHLKACLPLIHNQEGCTFRLLPAAKEASLPEKNPSDLCCLIDGVIVTILSFSEPSLNDSI